MKFKLSLVALCCYASLAYGQLTEAQEESIFNAWYEIAVDMQQHFQKGEYQEAVNAAKEALDYVEEKLPYEHPLIGNSYDNLGTVMHHAGFAEEAVPYLEQSVEHGLAYLGEEHEDYITRLSNLGMLFTDLGYNAKAEPLFQKAIDLQVQTLGKEHEYYPIFINNLALLYQTEGRDQASIELFTEAKAYTEKLFGKDHISYATRLNNLASAYREIGEKEKALGLMEEAIQINLNKLGPEHPYCINTLRNLHVLYSFSRPFDTCMHLMQENLSNAEEVLGATHLQTLTIQADMASLYFQYDSLQKAEKIYDKVITAFSESFNPKSNRVNVYLGDIAAVQDRAGKKEVAFQNYDRILDNMYDGFLLNSGRFSEKDQLEYYSEYGKLIEDFYHFASKYIDDGRINGKVYDNVLFFKGMLLQDKSQKIALLRNHSDSTVQKRFIYWNRLRTQLAKSYNQKNKNQVIDSLENLIGIEERFLASQSSQFQDDRRIIKWQNIAEKLQANEVAIEFVRARMAKEKFQYIAYLIKKDIDSPIAISLCLESDLSPLLNLKKKLYGYSSKANTKNLQQLIWKPIAEHLKTSDRVYFAPTGLLHRINMLAIPISPENTLGDLQEWHQLNSTRDLFFTKEEYVNNCKDAFVFGGISYDEQDRAEGGNLAVNRGANMSFQDLYNGKRKKWEPLQWTEKEALEVQRMLENASFEADLFTKKNAKEEVLKEMEAAPNVLHFATHGYFLPNKVTAKGEVSLSAHPMVRSGLIMAGANHVWTGGKKAGEDGILTAYEIAQMDLSDTDLVILSACDTGLGDINANEGVYGLQRAFKMAGAKHVIMSLWSVRDKQSLEFMTTFYKGWLEDKKSVPAAFRFAQSQLRKKYNKPFNPSVWAGFVLIE